MGVESADAVPCPATARPSDKAAAMLVARGWPADTCLRCIRIRHDDTNHVAVLPFGAGTTLTLGWKD